MINEKITFIPINIAILTISDTRDKSSDQSGTYLANAIQEKKKITTMDGKMECSRHLSPYVKFDLY